MPADTSTRTSDALRRLAEGIGELTSSDAWQRYLDAARTFHSYSFGNTLLILSQMPDASRVAGFHTWRKLGRSVRKGEKALWILAPVTRRLRDADDETPEDEQAPRRVVSFRAVPVFDISSTDGEALPHVATRLTGDDPSRSYDQLRDIARDLRYTVEEEYLPGERNGDCDFAARRIRIEVRNDERQMVKSLAHEIAHALLHDGFEGPRELAECEAESVAYIVCDGIGLDSGDYSFGYVAGWAGGGEEARNAIGASGGRIQQAAHHILDALEKAETKVAA